MPPGWTPVASDQQGPRGGTSILGARTVQSIRSSTRMGVAQASACRERRPHGVTGVTFILMSKDEVGDFAGEVHHAADFVRVSNPGRLGETGRAVPLPRVALQYAEDRVERDAGGWHGRRVGRVAARCNRVGLPSPQAHLSRFSITPSRPQMRQHRLWRKINTPAPVVPRGARLLISTSTCHVLMISPHAMQGCSSEQSPPRRRVGWEHGRTPPSMRARSRSRISASPRAMRLWSFLVPRRSEGGY
jgi:hypothetical protein